MDASQTRSVLFRIRLVLLKVMILMLNLSHYSLFFFFLATGSLSIETEHVFLTIANSDWSQSYFISD